MNTKDLDLELKQKEENESIPPEQLMHIDETSKKEPFPPMPVEIICERAHCVIYEYAIITVKFVADEFKGRIRVKPVVRRGSKKNVEHYLELCRANGQHLSVPAILMGGKLVFTYVPGLEELRNAMQKNLAAWEERLGSRESLHDKKCRSARQNNTPPP